MKTKNDVYLIYGAVVGYWSSYGKEFDLKQFVELTSLFVSLTFNQLNSVVSVWSLLNLFIFID